MKKFHFLILMLHFQLFGCSSQELAPKSQGKYTIYVVSQGWHTGIVVSSGCIADSLWPKDQRFDQYEKLIIGWGDTDYYQNQGFNLWYFTKAAIWPTPSTLHIKAFNQMQEIEHLIKDKVELRMSEQQYKNLCAFLKDQFQLDTNNHFIPQTAGYYFNSHFFKANRKYTAINNSNVWTGKALKEAGFNISPYRHLTQKSIIKRAKEIESLQ